MFNYSLGSNISSTTASDIEGGHCVRLHSWGACLPLSRRRSLPTPKHRPTGSEEYLWILLMNSMTLGKIRVRERAKRHCTQYEATED